MNVADIGTITSIKGNTADVQVEGRPLLLGLPILSIKVGDKTPEHSLESGDRVLIMYVSSDLNKGVIVGSLQDDYDSWYDTIRGVLNE